MGRMKDLWMDIFEELAEELGRQPSDDEVNSRIADITAAMRDTRLIDNRRLG